MNKERFNITHPKTKVEWSLPISLLPPILRLSFGQDKRLIADEISQFIDSVEDKTQINNNAKEVR